IEPIPSNVHVQSSRCTHVHRQQSCIRQQTQCSCNGFLIYINTALVDWHSKQQTTIKTTVFGTEFVAMKTRVDILRGLRCKLKMMHVAINVLHTYGDNMCVIKNTPKPESTLNKKIRSVCNHIVR
ncbi:hypothetical protein ACHAXS_008996, partial [Conticribra weissflogii]